MKRRAPSPTGEQTTADIAIARPTASKIEQNKGMIPPPPPSIGKPPSRASSPVPRKLSVSLTSAPQVNQINEMLASLPPQPPVIQVNEAPLVARSMESITSSSENLVKTDEPSSDANKAATSPPGTLRPTRKVTEVTTIKRQPKTGWL